MLSKILNDKKNIKKMRMKLSKMFSENLKPHKMLFTQNQLSENNRLKFEFPFYCSLIRRKNFS